MKILDRRKFLKWLTVASIGGAALSKASLDLPAANAAVGFTRAKYSTTMKSTSSTSWSLMPGMKIPYYVTIQNRELVVLFSAEVQTTATNSMHIRAVDTGTIMKPGYVNLATSQGNWQCRSFNFFKTNIGAGSNMVVKIQWKSDASGEIVKVGSRTLILMISQSP